MVNVKSIENGIAAKPFIPGDAPIAIEIIQEENFLHGMAEGCSSLHFSFYSI